ncbi:MAG: hypothetical protein EP343_18500 [Deltaproteobacteria bacterium]|nr:MAG: hypothetical protein EP343_18500 [Deltaproteobacteria bacterium]
MRVFAMCIGLIFIIFAHTNCNTLSPEGACEAFYTELARLVSRCDSNKTYLQAYDELLRSATCSCDRVERVRDSRLLVDTCFPLIRKASCNDIAAVIASPSCNNQLIMFPQSILEPCEEDD